MLGPEILIEEFLARGPIEPEIFANSGFPKMNLGFFVVVRNVRDIDFFYVA